jgi:predicted acyltransferase
METKTRPQPVRRDEEPERAFGLPADARPYAEGRYPELKRPRRAPSAEPPVRAEGAARPQSSPRLGSLDAFRGLTILGMLLVNNVALDNATPASLTHAGWNQGVHFADMVFPWFLLIVGVALPFSFASHDRKGLPRRQYDLRVVTRALTLILLGCLIDSSLAHRPVFGLGVLQLIGCAYLLATMAYELPLRRRLMVVGGLLLAQWAALRFIPVPGAGAGVLTESENFISYLNETYLAPVSLRGLASVVPTTALVLIGTAIGDMLRRAAFPPIAQAARLLALGVGLIGAGWLWSLDLAFSKALWTASYVLYTGGWGLLILGFLYLIMDVAGWRAWAFPLEVFGANAIVAYVAPILFKVHILQEWRWTMPDGSHLPLQQALLHWCYLHAGHSGGGWLYTGAYILFWWIILLVMYRKRVFLRV